MRTGNPSFLAAVVFVASVSSAIATTTAKQDEPADEPERAPLVKPQVHKGDGWAIAAPADWGLFTKARPPMLLYLVGDGRAGVPFMDGTLSALKAGLTVERFPAGEGSLKQFADKDVKQLDNAKRFKITRTPEFEDVTLDDGTAARLMKVEFVRPDNRGRHSIHRKVYCLDAQGRRLVATGFLTCSRPGAPFVRAIGMPEFLEAHLKSLVLDAAKLDPAKLEPAYERLDANVGGALARTSEGNALIEEKKYAEAAAAFREALAKSEFVSAAHNGLAWALLHAADPPRPQDVKEAVTAATRAAELTEELDYSVLDTLALAHHRNGDREQAIKAVRKALELQPGHPELKSRLESIEAEK